MIDIISKKDGPRREDVAIHKLVRENKHTITRLADQLSQGSYSASQRPVQPTEPLASTSSYFTLSSPASKEDAKPYIRISLNGRVVMVDDKTSKQMHFLGEIRYTGESKVFLLATAKNKFFSPADNDLMAKLADFDHIELGADFTEDMLKHSIHTKLGLEEI